MNITRKNIAFLGVRYVGHPLPAVSGKHRKVVGFEIKDRLNSRELSELVFDVVGFSGRLVFNVGKPDGTSRKRLDVSRVAAASRSARTALRDGIRMAYEQTSFRNA